MYPHERSLVKRLANQPFALIGVNSDRDKAKLKTRMRQENITWRSFWNGPLGTGGPISRAWKVRGWPTIYVIDADGIIRYKNVRGAQLDEAVDSLLRKQHEQLTRGLESNDAEQRGLAAFQLARQGGSDADEKLRQLLEDANPLVRQRAATGLGTRNEPLKPLLPLLRDAGSDKVPAIRVAALQLLAKAGDQQAAPQVLQSLESQHTSVVLASITAVRVLGMGAAAAPVLGKLTAHADQTVAERAINELAELEPSLALATLKEQVARTNHPYRVRLSIALYRQGDVSQENQFADFMHDKSPIIRREILSLATVLPGYDSTPLSLIGLRDSDTTVRQLARQALQKSESPKARQALREHVTVIVDAQLPKLENPVSRSAAVKQLQDLGSVATPVLLERLAGKQTPVHPTITQIIDRTNGPDLPQMLGVALGQLELADRTRFRLETLLRKRGKAGQVVINRLLKHESPEVRSGAVRMLLGNPDPTVQQAAETALQDESLMVRAYAACVLSARGQQVGRPILLEVLRGDDLALKRYTIWGLFHFKDEETTRLVAAAADEDPLMIVPVALTLGRQDTEHSAQILGEWVQGTDLARKSAALRSVRQMKHPQGLALAREANRQAADLRRAARAKGGNYTAQQVTGPPDTPLPGDVPTAWASRTPNGTDEWLQVGFGKGQTFSEIRIHESFNPGAVTRITTMDEDGTEKTLWQGQDPGYGQPAIFVSIFKLVSPVSTDNIRIHLDTSLVSGWNEIDAVGVVDDQGTLHWAETASASSRFGQTRQPATQPRNAGNNISNTVDPSVVVDRGVTTTPVPKTPVTAGYTAHQATGSPNTETAGDFSTAWASRAPNMGPQWLEVRFGKEHFFSEIRVHESFNPGAVTRITTKGKDGAEKTLWQGQDPGRSQTAIFVSIFKLETRVSTDHIRIHLDTNLVAGWNEIDAVGVVDEQGDLHWAKTASASSSFAQAQQQVQRALAAVVAISLAARAKGGNYVANQATGVPDTVRGGDFPTAWASRIPNGTEEWLQVEFSKKQLFSEIRIHESFNPGAVTRITTKSKDGAEQTLWQGQDPGRDEPAVFVSIFRLESPVSTDNIRIHLDTSLVSGWNEIDAVGVVDDQGKLHWAETASASSVFRGFGQ